MGHAALRVQDDTQGRRKPAGGFVFITGTALLSAWWAYRSAIITLLDLRVWLTCFELVARRCGAQRGSPRVYTAREAMVLTGSKSENSIRRSIGRLRRAGLLVWSASEITVGQGLLTESDADQAELIGFVEQVKNHHRRIPVPRRMVRLLARDGTKVAMATAFGHMLRCLYYRDGRCRPSGICKASWIANVFGVDVRNVKAARRDLVQRGVLTMERRSQWFLNRYGPVVTVNLEWAETGSTGSCGLPPPRSETGSGLPPPRRKPELLRIRNQEPPPATAGARTWESKSSPPNLRHVVPGDLVDAARLATLHEQAGEAGYVSGSEADRLKFFAAAEHARAFGRQNPAGLFAATVRQRRWSFLTLADEDAARRKLMHAGMRECVSTPRTVPAAPVRVGNLLSGLMSGLRRTCAGSVGP